MKTKKIVISALFAALTFVATFIIKVPTVTGGFVNIGDCMVIISGIFLGPVYGALAAGIGSALTDLIGGYLVFAPATLIIKSAMALVCALLYKDIKKTNAILAAIVCAVIAEVIMVSGYFLFDLILTNSFETATAGMLGNLVQAAFGLICSIVLYKILSTNKYINQLRD